MWSSYVRPQWHRQTMVQIAWLALPLGLTGFFNSLRVNVPRYAVAGSLGVADLGVYALLAYTLVVMDTLAKPARMIMLPSLARPGPW